MRDFIVRFVAAGLLVASLPWVSSQFGDRVAGVLLLFPVVTISGLTVVGLSGGMAAVAHASAGSLSALPAVVLFLLGVHIAARNHVTLPVTLVIGVTAWLAAASIAVLIGRPPGEQA